MAHPDVLFDLYRSAKTDASVGFAKDGDSYHVIEVTKSGVKASTLPPVKCMSVLAKKLKDGYSREASPMYFDMRSGQFRKQHPDLAVAGDWLLAASPPGIEPAIAILSQTLSTLPSSVIFPEEIDLWVAQQGQNTTYVIACRDHSAYAVALAQLAYEKGWPLRSSDRINALPDTPPSVSPKAWVEWLSNAHRTPNVQAVMRAFGYTVEQNITSAFGGSTDLNLAGLL